MSLIASALIPLALLIAVGFALNRTRFLPATFWPGLDRLTYWVLFPSLIFVSLANAERGLAGAGRVAITIWGGIAIVSATGLLLRWRLAADGPSFTSVFQGAIRFNSYAAFLVVPVLFPGSAGLTALAVALTVPAVNVLCVSVLARYGAGARLDPWRLVLSIAGNPLIIASLLGIVASRIEIPLGSLEEALQILGRAALATGLLSVGASLRFRSVRAGWRQVLASMVLKFALLPLATAAIGVAVALPPALLAPLLLFQAMPTASSSFVLARAMGGDEALMASILAVHTLAALVWLPLAYAMLRAAF